MEHACTSCRAVPCGPIILALALFLPACGQGGGGAVYVTTADSALGLEEGAGVYVSGVKVGEVKRVALQERKARIEFSAAQDMALHEDARASIRAFTLADTGMHIELDPGGPDRPPLKPGGSVACDASSVMDGKMDSVMASIDSVLASLVSGEGILGRLLKDPQLADKVEKYLSDRCPQPQEDKP
ncbi:MAG: MlaD family protein [Pseudomonadota bacterium]